MIKGEGFGNQIFEILKYEATKMRARLILTDGTRFEGLSLGAMGTSMGEVVFNTAMMGYQEILTDPSYHFQLVTMTYPQIGNYGALFSSRSRGEN